MNFLYYGDNLDVLRRYVRDDTVDLVYLDPPFKSNQDYNVLFAEKDGTGAASQFKAFEDTWEWNQASAAMYQETVERGGRVSDVMQAFRQFLGANDMLAYLTMMAPRLVELRRVLKPTGSIYLHCDPTASHYLKLLMDAVFGPPNYRNEISWVRSQPKSHTTINFPNCRDVILRYSKADGSKFFKVYGDYDEAYLKSFYRFVDDKGRRYRLGDLTNPNKNRPNLTYEFLGITRVWRWTKQRMEDAWREGLIYQSKPGSVPQLKRYLDKMHGQPLSDNWGDIEHLHGSNMEALGYPTQKPEALLERIIKSSCEEGDTVLDPFCGCGTAIAVAQRLNRRWIGIDITHLAIGLIKSRLRDAFGDEISKTYKVIGEPVSVQDAMELAKEDPFQFQWWALGLVGARRTEQRKGADQGIDGRLYFHDEGDSGKTKQIILSVKSGHVSVRDVRDLRGVIEREKAEIGVLISLEDVTKPMTTEAASAGFYKSVSWQKNYPRIQILTIAELLSGGGIAYPHVSNVTFKRAPKVSTPEPEQLSLPAPPNAGSKRKRK